MRTARNRSRNMLKNMKYLAVYYDIYIGEDEGDQGIGRSGIEEKRYG